MRKRLVAVLLAGALAGCGSASRDAVTTTSDVAPVTTLGASSDVTMNESLQFTAEVWADNWFALYVNGEKVGEDSVPITTERSFNSETIAFTATYPLTVGVIAKDFVENASGLEYIGTDRQQMGDGGLILQITDSGTGKVVAVSNQGWRTLVIDEAPLNPECEKSTDPLTECKSRNVAEPEGWTDPGFDDAGWPNATAHTADAVGPKEGYDNIAWDSAAQFVWGPNLKTDNTVLLRTTVAP